jgi:hypothetical protein
MVKLVLQRRHAGVSLPGRYKAQASYRRDLQPVLYRWDESILEDVEKLETASFEIEEERVAWEGLASSCAAPIRRFAAFALVGFISFIVITTAVIVFYQFTSDRDTSGVAATVPRAVFDVTMLLGVAVAIGGYLIWLISRLRTYRAFSAILSRGGLDPHRPTAGGLRAYSDEQLLALRSRYERLQDGKLRERLGRTFGFHGNDEFSLGPLSVLHGTFEMGALRVEWETQLILRSGEPMPEISWWTEGRHNLLPRKPDEARKLVYALRYTGDSVRELKRRYGYRTERWHATVPEGKLFDAVRDLESSQRIQLALSRRSLG